MIQYIQVVFATKIMSSNKPIPLIIDSNTMRTLKSLVGVCMKRFTAWWEDLNKMLGAITYTNIIPLAAATLDRICLLQSVDCTYESSVLNIWLSQSSIRTWLFPLWVIPLEWQSWLFPDLQLPNSPRNSPIADKNQILLNFTYQVPAYS